MASSKGGRRRPNRVTPDDAGTLRELNEHLVLSSLQKHESLEASEREREELRAVLEGLSEAVVLTDRTGAVSVVNDAGRRLFGIVPEESLVLRAEYFRGIDGAPLSADVCPLRHARAGIAFADMALILCRPNHEDRRLMVSGTNIRGRDTTPHFVLVMRDVTEQLRLEARVVQSERLAAIGTLSAGIAHEINNPLAYLITNVDYAIETIPHAVEQIGHWEGAAIPAFRDMLQGIEKALDEAKEGGLRVRRVVSDLKQFGRIDGAARSVVALSSVIDGAIRMTENLVRHHAEVRRDYGPIAFVDVNVGQLEQVFINLLVNAAQAIGEKGAPTNEIVIRTFVDAAGRPTAEVRDSGPGIPFATQRRIFDPFFTTKTVGQGFGLGLSICYSLVTSFGGEIAVDSPPGQGATFRISLPAAAEPERSKVTPPVPGVPLRRGRVLVIDDEESIGRALQRILLKSNDVTVVSDPALALSMLTDGATFDIVLCDLMMPKMTGIDLIEATSEKNPAIARRFVFLTGGAFTPKAVAFLETTTYPTIQKPIATEVLRRIVNEYVREPR